MSHTPGHRGIDAEVMRLGAELARCRMVNKWLLEACEEATKQLLWLADYVENPKVRDAYYKAEDAIAKARRAGMGVTP